MRPKTSITGVKPTGTPHLGNYYGAIQPALRLSAQHQTFFFIADAHALNAMSDPSLLRAHTYEIAATFLAFELDTDAHFLYRQSDVPEVFELSMLLTNTTRKSTLDLAHAYKAKVSRNVELGRAPDDGINMGLYTYPLLMAADILLVSADLVPVGKDQVQHVEITRELAHGFNLKYKELLPKPAPFLSEAPIVIGLDGRKMSKSYNNTVPLFAPPAQMKKLIRQYQTDSTTVEAPKTVEGSGLFQLYELAASPEKVSEMKARLERGGTGWGVLKDAVADELNRSLEGPRERYQALLAKPSLIEEALEAGAAKVKARAQTLLQKMKNLVYARG